MTIARLDIVAIPLFGTQVIEASAGTGKTYTITSLLVRLVAEGHLGIEQVLAVTFTNAAAAELAGRIRKRVVDVRAALSAGDAGDDQVAAHLLGRPDRSEITRRLDRAVRDVDRASVTTIHGFCARALSEYALRAGARPDTTLLGDDRGVLYDVVTDFWSTEVASLPVSEFRALGGEGLHPELAQVAKGVVSAPGVPLDRVATEVDDGEALARYALDFERTRVEFFERGRSLLECLHSARGLNKTSYSEAITTREFGKVAGYFQAGELDPAAYPDLEKGLFTSERVSRSANKNQVAPTHELLDVLQAHRACAQEAVVVAQRKREALLRRLAADIERRLDDEHTRLRTQSFDGLLRSLSQALESPPFGAELASAMRERFPALLIDEFQDTDPIQYGVFRGIYRVDERASAGRTALFFIGDPKQSIYRFRGADVTTYLAAAGQSAPGAGMGQVWTLDVNYRSGPRVIAAHNALFGLHAAPFGGSSIRYLPVQAAPGRGDLLRDENGQAAAGLRILRRGDVDTIDLAAAEVAHLLASGARLGERAVSPRDIAVLTRTNAQAETVQAALRHLGIPAVMHGDRSVFEAPEAKEIRRVLRAWLEPGRRPLLHAALATRLIGRTAADLARLGTDADAFERETEAVRRSAMAWRQRGIAVALELLFAEENLLARTLADVDGERRMTNFRHLLELLHQAEVDRHLGMVGLLRFLETAIAAPTGHEMAAEARQVRLESDDDAVTLTTVHKSKGLEYGIVVLPQIGRPERRNFRTSPWARYHDPARDGREFLHIGDDEEAHARSRREDREEALRLGYVGVTRAEHQVIAIIEDDKAFSALAWFLHGGALDDRALDAEGWKQLSDAAVEQDYARLALQAQGAVRIESAGPERLPAPRYERRALGQVVLTPPMDVSAPVTQVRTSSFSAMTRTRAPLSRAEREGKDVDRAKAAAGGTEAPSPAEQVIFMDAFPRGAGPGDALHAILERLPFAGGSEQARQSVISSELLRRGFDQEHAATLERSLGAALEAPLTPTSICLSQLQPSECSRELEFSLPVRRRAAEGLLSAETIERCLTAHARAHLDLATGAFLSKEYVRALGRLDFPAFSGFLRGFLDLVVWKDGQIFVVDYKSNHLGSRYADYEKVHLHTAMESHHYLLQGLLYAVAVHRYAGTRIPDYRYASHFGGVSYLFLRGVPPEEPARGSGVYFFRPSEEMVEELSLAFGRQEAS